MSSAAYLTWDKDEGVTSEKWAAFCVEHAITYSPRTVGRNVFYAGAVEVHFGEANSGDLPRLPDGRLDFDAASWPAYAEQVTFSTFHGGGAVPDVARLARALWLRHGGRLSADPEIRSCIVAATELFSDGAES